MRVRNSRNWTALFSSVSHWLLFSSDTHTQEKRETQILSPSVGNKLCFSPEATVIAGNALERSPASILELKSEIINPDLALSSEKAAGESHRYNTIFLLFFT